MEGKRSLTYKEVDEIADNLAKFLYEKNIRKGVGAVKLLLILTRSLVTLYYLFEKSKLG